MYLVYLVYQCIPSASSVRSDQCTPSVPVYIVPGVPSYSVPSVPVYLVYLVYQASIPSVPSYSVPRHTSVPNIPSVSSVLVYLSMFLDYLCSLFSSDI